MKWGQSIAKRLASNLPVWRIARNGRGKDADYRQLCYNLVSRSRRQVGDYVLSPELCVERKSLPDLRQSLASGRLYHQARVLVPRTFS